MWAGREEIGAAVVSLGVRYCFGTDTTANCQGLGNVVGRHRAWGLGQTNADPAWNLACLTSPYERDDPL